MRKLMTLAAVAASSLAFGVVGASPASAAVVTVTLAGAGTGTVTSAPAGINCSNTPGHELAACSFDFPGNVFQVKLSASPDSSFVFRDWSGTAGGTCGSGSENPCLTAVFLSPVSATATFGPPPDPPSAATEPADAIGPFSATLRGHVNPGGDSAVTGCYFEIGTTTDYGQTAACTPSDLGSGDGDVAVSSGSGTLKAATRYHFRLVAKNAGGARAGGDQTFTTAAAAPDRCPNAGVRSQQGTGALPDCMAYEMASPPEKFSQNAGLTAINDDASRLLIGSLGGFADAPSTIGLGNVYFSLRSADRWDTKPIALSPNEFDSNGQRRDHLPDLSQALLLTSTLEQADNLGVQFFFRGTDGSLRPASPPIHALSVPPAARSFVTYQAGARDLSSFVFTTASTSILPGYDPVGSTNVQNMYEVAGANTDAPAIRRVDLDNAGLVAGPICSGRAIGGAGRKANAVSADGEKVFFSAHSAAASTAACSAAGTLRVLARVNGTSTVEVSASHCNRVANPPAVPACNAPAAVRFEGASRDGKTVFLSTTQQLTNDDVDTASDLYEYRFADGSAPAILKRVSAPVVGAPDAFGTLLGVLSTSGDGQRVYFAARGRITTVANGRGAQPTASSNNLYVYERTSDHPSGRVAFVMTLGASDSVLWGTNRFAQPAGASGRVLVFPSPTRLTSDDADSVADIYRYDAVTDELLRVSHAKEGFAGDGNGAFAAGTSIASSGGVVGPNPQMVSTDGGVILFTTAEALDPRDLNGSNDLYRWKDGQVDLITDGQGPEAGLVTDNGSYGVSPDGNSVVFPTAQRLVPEDRDGANDIYVARIDGGFKSEAEPDASCTGDACQGGSAVPPGLPVAGSVSLEGAGDVPVPPAPGLPQGAVTVSKLKAVRGTAAKVGVRVSAAGSVSVSGGSVTRVSREVRKAGTVTVKVALNAKARRTLSRKRTVTVRVKVAFTPSVGSSASKTVRMTFKQPVAKKAKQKAKARRGSSGRGADAKGQR